MRTELQRTADSIDCSLYRVICGCESEYSKAKGRKDHKTMALLESALQDLESARIPIRSLMSEEDRKATSQHAAAALATGSTEQAAPLPSIDQLQTPQGEPALICPSEIAGYEGASRAAPQGNAGESPAPLK